MDACSGEGAAAWRVGQEVGFPCHGAEIAAADRWGDIGVVSEVSNGELGEGREVIRPSPRLSTTPPLTNLIHTRESRVILTLFTRNVKQAVEIAVCGSSKQSGHLVLGLL